MKISTYIGTRGLLLTILLSLAMASCRFISKSASYKYYEDHGASAFDKQSYDEAAIDFRNAVQENPTAWEPHDYLGQIAVRRSFWEQASDEFGRAIQLNPAALSPHLHMAELLMGGGQFAEGQQEIQAAQKIDPKNFYAEILLGRIGLLQKNYTEALNHFGRAEQLDPKDPLGWTSSGVAKIGLVQYSDAESDFKKALQLDGTSAEAYRNLGNLYRLIHRDDEATALLTQAVASNPKSVDVAFVLANYLFDKGQLNSVEQLFSQMEQRSSDFQNLDVQLGDFWSLHHDSTRALPFYETAIKKDSANQAVAKKLIAAYIPVGRVNDAEVLNNALLAKNANDQEARGFQGAIRYLRGDNPGALAVLKQVVKENSDQLFAQYYLGLALMSSGSDEDARRAFSECLRINPQFPEAQLKLAELALLRQDWVDAATYAQKVLSLEGSVAAELVLAQAQLNKGDLNGATAALQVAQSAEPQDSQVYEIKSQLDIKKHDLKNASADFGKASSLSSQPAAVLARYADYLVQNDHAREAAAETEKYISANPSNPAGYEQLAALQLQTHDYPGAAAACRKAISTFPDRWQPHYLLAEALQRTGDQQQALSEFDEAMQKNPNQPSIPIQAGYMLVAEKQYTQAKHYLDVGLKQDPNNWTGRKALAELYAGTGENLDQALNLAQSLKNERPSDPYVGGLAGWIYYRKHIYSLAVTELSSAAVALPRDPEVQFHLGLAYAANGQTQAARTALSAALKLGLNGDDLSQAQDELHRLQSD
jgi:Flp pilus assembly protein TadD